MLRSFFLFLAFMGTGLVAYSHQNAPGSHAQNSPSAAPAASQPIAIVVNTSNPVDSLSMSELRKIFLGERGHWSNGRRITIIMLEQEQPERRVVLSTICQMNESEFNNHFLHGLFTGEVLVSPKTLATSVGVRKFIFNVPGAIGYMRLSDVDNSVKVIRIGEHLPLDKAYPLHVTVDK